MRIAPLRRIEVDGRAGKCTIWNVADIHLGCKNCDEERLVRVIKAIEADPHSYYILLGDQMECIVPQDTKRWDARTVSDWVWEHEDGLRCPVEAQKERLYSLLVPIAGKCLGIVNGNHEEAVATYYAQNPGAWLSGQLKAPFLDACGVVPLNIARGPKEKGHECRRLMIVADHGTTSATTPGGRSNMLQRSMHRWVGVDAVFMGHAHSQDIVVLERIGFTRDCRETKMHRTVGILSGAFFRTYLKDTPSYGEKKGYPPSVLGPLAIEVGFTSEADGMKTRLSIRPVEPRY